MDVQDVKLRISRGSRAVAAKKCTKMRDARAKCQSKPIRSTLGSNLSSDSDPGGVLKEFLGGDEPLGPWNP